MQYVPHVFQDRKYGFKMCVHNVEWTVCAHEVDLNRKREEKK